MVEEKGGEKGVILIWRSPLAPLKKGGTRVESELPVFKGDERGIEA